ncbi:zinc finger MYM-type protein 5-like [Hydra vulgaris]|uniref:zinc finger MYM-type protein 5-like n=1 Tax=Hydra vulgaris TaxID=6087 RepID=UPI0002B4CCA6|nr:zinc finger MYM-type protein 5-like [Hydra vulgaris]
MSKSSQSTTDVISSPESSQSTTDIIQNVQIQLISLDPAEWLEDLLSLRTEIVKRGAFQLKDFDFPMDSTIKRRFSISNYQRDLTKDQKIPRPWLVYFKKMDSVFCFCCKLFGTEKDKLTKGGLDWKIGKMEIGLDRRDWKNIYARLSEHDTSPDHTSY